LDVTNQVKLKDLYPTNRQDIKSAYNNAYLAADIIDRWRFLKENMMPWDDQEDWDYRPRLKLFCDMKENKIDQYLAAHLRYLISWAKNEAKTVEKYADHAFNDSSDDDDSDKDIEPRKVYEDAKRCLDMIMEEFDLFGNLTVKKIDENLEGCRKKLKLEKQTFAVSENSGFFNLLKQKVSGDLGIQLVETLDEALAKCTGDDEIHLLIGEHTLEKQVFVGSLSITGDRVIPTADFYIDLSQFAKITNFEEKCTLLAFDGNAVLENIGISCRYVHAGIIVASGVVNLKNCIIDYSDFGKGVSILGGTVVTLENCVIQDLKIGIVVEKGAKLTLKNCQIQRCEIGMKVFGKSEITLENSSISDCEKHAIVQYTKTDTGPNEELLITESLLEEPEKLIGVALVGECEFECNKDGDLCTYDIANFVEGEWCEAAPFFDP
jgi:hypothetical protein